MRPGAGGGRLWRSCGRRGRIRSLQSAPLLPPSRPDRRLLPGCDTFSSQAASMLTVKAERHRKAQAIRGLQVYASRSCMSGASPHAASELTPERQPGESEFAVPCQGPVKVPGMERYMWNKQRARQLAEEQQAREAKAFLQNPKARLEPCTVPEPFALQTELREVRHSSSISSKPIQIMAGPGLPQQHYGSHGCGMRHRHTDGNARQVEVGHDWLHISHRPR